MVGLLGAVVGGWGGKAKHLFEIVKTIKTAFPTSPVFRSQQLQKLAQVQVVVGDAIFKDLIASPACPLQSEWYYSENCRRWLLNWYSIEVFRAYVTTHKASYFIPNYFARLVQRALYDGRYDDVSEACEIVADPRYATSLTVGKQLAANVHQYLFLARKIALAALEDSKAAGAKRQPAKPGSARPSKKSVIRDCAAQASKQANLVDRAQSKYINLGYLYFGASLWGEDLRFTARAGATGRTVLRQKEYRDSFWYYYSGAYQR